MPRPPTSSCYMQPMMQEAVLLLLTLASAGMGASFGENGRLV
ncbi:hypothetical protein BIWAKO_01081 [Bosea sp. BIWAKO-01]|nr:hypothetical protein BIWAKO_01081 [Bosea sp. BIWAKO-01]